VIRLCAAYQRIYLSIGFRCRWFDGGHRQMNLGCTMLQPKYSKWKLALHLEIVWGISTPIVGALTSWFAGAIGLLGRLLSLNTGELLRKMGLAF